ncbi:lecithin retinol acyltransferase family protein [Cupriavidus sp. CuC1]|uniref:lecithin retinol acyltransferase family protein n=1 Tax=Cupriavidus sp. CuC1 TaxID=3373131 RepID=UPI0037D0AA83
MSGSARHCRPWLPLRTPLDHTMYSAFGKGDRLGDILVGSHLITARFGYTHHGIYVGRGKVVHYGGFSHVFSAGPIEEVSILSFANGHSISVIHDPAVRFQGADVVRRARSRIGENRYRLLTNNCEHFCAWCIEGVSRSAQVDGLLRMPRMFARRLLSVFYCPVCARPGTEAPAKSVPV